ncbi:MAG: RidA family protein [Planctomycetota bacterium]|jgi:enamine deaminase RidA (YjgF/YER057c/UK114 family)
MTHGERLASLGLTLPPVTAPVGSYVPALRIGADVYTSGQLPVREGRLTCTGKVGAQVALDDAAAAAELAALNAVAAVASVAGGIDHIEQIVRVCVFVSSANGFTDQPKVANGASNLLGKIFGPAGRHVRSAVGVAELPLDAAVELELLARVT